MSKAAFTRQTKVGKLVLPNSSWYVWTAQKQSANTFYLSPTVCQCVCRLFLRRSHTPTWVCQHEFANLSLPCEGRLKCTRISHSRKSARARLCPVSGFRSKAKKKKARALWCSSICCGLTCLVSLQHTVMTRIAVDKSTDHAKQHFTITAEIQARSLAKFYGQYADRHMNLKFVRRVSERARAIRQFSIVKNKLMSVFNESVLLLTTNFVITLSK